MTAPANVPGYNQSPAAESMPVTAASEGQLTANVQQSNNDGETIKLPNGVHTNNAVASSSKLADVKAEPVSAVALGKRKWVESEVIADSARDIDLSLQLDYLATQYPEQRIPPPNLHPPGFVHYDIPLRDQWNTETTLKSPSKQGVKLEEGVENVKTEVETVKPAEGPPPFRDAEDVVERLLPWHVWQLWDEDLDWQPLSDTAKQSAALLPKEQQKRWLDINKRFRAVREREAKHASNVPSLLQLHPNLAQNLRAEIGPLQQKLRAARTELDNITRAKREQEDRARRIKEETERREKETKRIDDLKRGPGVAIASQPNSRPGSGPSTPGAQIAAAGSSASAAKPAQPPVVVNLALTHLPQAIKLGLLALPNGPPPAVKPPATIVRTVDEQKVTLTVDLARCSQAHIAFLAKCLNIQPVAPNTAAPSQSTPTKPPPKK